MMALVLWHHWSYDGVRFMTPLEIWRRWGYDAIWAYSTLPSNFEATCQPFFIKPESTDFGRHGGPMIWQIDEMKSTTSPTIQDRFRATEWTNESQNYENTKSQKIVVVAPKLFCLNRNFWACSFGTKGYILLFIHESNSQLWKYCHVSSNLPFT